MKVDDRYSSVFRGDVAKANDRYDSLFAYYWDGHARAGVDPADWRRAKAVALVKSSMNPWALSSTGAQGLMQLTVNAVVELDLIAPPGDLFNPETNIRLGVRYLLERCWVPAMDAIEYPATRWALAHASYDAGPATVRSLWRDAASPRLEEVHLWSGFLARLPGDTQAYLERIQYALDRV